MTIDEQLTELRKECSLCHIITESTNPVFIGYPCLCEPTPEEVWIKIHLPAAGAEIFYQFQICDPFKSHDVCGLFADWIVDNAELMLWHHMTEVKKVDKTADDEAIRIEFQTAYGFLLTFLQNEFTKPRT